MPWGGVRYGKTVTGTFLSRPNRFIAKVEVDGEVETVHVKNTGRCREILVPGARHALSYLVDRERLKRELLSSSCPLGSSDPIPRSIRSTPTGTPGSTST